MSAAGQAHAEAHRLKTELGYGARRIGVALGISRYAAQLLLDQPLAEPVADGERPVAEPVGQVAEPVADVVADPVGRASGEAAGQGPKGPVLVIELDRFPGLAEDLADLTATGASLAEVVNFAVDKLATAYRNALARGLLQDGQRFDVESMRLRPSALLRRAG